VRQNLVQLPTPLLALLAGRDTLVDNQATLEILKRVQRVPIHVDEFQGANHVLPASVPLAELVGRIWHWFSAPESGLDPRLVIQQVPAFPTPTEACEWR
jgi:esterase/lipase